MHSLSPLLPHYYKVGDRHRKGLLALRCTSICHWRIYLIVTHPFLALILAATSKTVEGENVAFYEIDEIVLYGCFVFLYNINAVSRAYVYTSL